VFTSTKKFNVSITRHVPLSIKQRCLMLFTSTYCLLRQSIPLFLKGSAQIFEVQSFEPLHGDSIHPTDFQWDSSLAKVQATPFEVHESPAQQPFPDDATSMSWSIVVHKDEIRPVSFMSGYNHWINDLIQVV